MPVESVTIAAAASAPIIEDTNPLALALAVVAPKVAPVIVYPLVNVQLLALGVVLLRSASNGRIFNTSAAADAVVLTSKISASAPVVS